MKRLALRSGGSRALLTAREPARDAKGSWADRSRAARPTLAEKSAVGTAKNVRAADRTGAQGRGLVGPQSPA